MGGIKMDFLEKLLYLRNLIRVCCPVWFWVYDMEGNLLESDCTVRDLNLIFEHSGCLQYAMEYQDSRPLCLGGSLGMLWGVAFSSQEDHRYIHVMGPVLNTELSQKSLNEAAQRLVRDPERRKLYYQMIAGLPVLSITIFQYFILMLHNCLTGEKIGSSDIQYQRRAKDEQRPPEEEITDDRHQVYLAEKQLLYHVREGDLNFRPALERASSMSSGIRVKTEDPLRQALISCTSFTTLCVRAAVEGGLPPDTAYSVGDAYIQSMAGCKKIPELGALNHAMYEDFVRRVHRIRNTADLSRPVLECREYIQMHAEEHLSLAMLARMTGYTDYYLSRKFKAETGESITDYINFVRVERAKIYLESTNFTVSEISLRLQYCSATYFSSVFRKITGKLPGEYRETLHGTGRS